MGTGNKHEDMPMNRADWNLLTLAAAEGRPLSPAQLQKSLFLLSRKLPEQITGGTLYNFVPYNYGPFDPAVYSDAVVLAAQGLATVQQSSGGWTEYAATDAGIKAAAQRAGDLAPAVSTYIKDVVTWVRSQSFASLVKAIYREYPDMRANSVFRD
jgi:hypothetical protein